MVSITDIIFTTHGWLLAWLKKDPPVRGLQHASPRSLLFVDLHRAVHKSPSCSAVLVLQKCVHSTIKQAINTPPVCPHINLLTNHSCWHLAPDSINTQQCLASHKDVVTKQISSLFAQKPVRVPTTWVASLTSSRHTSLSSQPCIALNNTRDSIKVRGEAVERSRGGTMATTATHLHSYMLR